MRIRMLIQMSGPRGDGQDWPAPHFMGGGTIMVGDGEGRDLVSGNMAEEVPEPEPAPAKTPKPPAEQAVARPVKEERAVVTEEVEDRAPSGLTTQNTPVTRPRAARTRST